MEEKDAFMLTKYLCIHERIMTGVDWRENLVDYVEEYPKNIQRIHYAWEKFERNQLDVPATIIYFGKDAVEISQQLWFEVLNLRFERLIRHYEFVLLRMILKLEGNTSKSQTIEKLFHCIQLKDDKTVEEKRIIDLLPIAIEEVKRQTQICCQGYEIAKMLGSFNILKQLPWSPSITKMIEWYYKPEGPIDTGEMVMLLVAPQVTKGSAKDERVVETSYPNGKLFINEIETAHLVHVFKYSRRARKNPKTLLSCWIPTKPTSSAMNLILVRIYSSSGIFRMT